jgi:uncharacterized membrane protein
VPPIVFPLVALAAVLHVAWNVLLKSAGDPLRTSGRAAIAGAAVFVPAAAVAYIAVGSPSIPPEALVLGVVSGLLEAAYFILLSAAYRRGDLSVVYPIARGTAPLLAVLLGVVVLGERLGPIAWVGVATLLGGLLAIQRPWRAIGTLRRGHGLIGDGAVAFAFATGVTIAAYSAVDRVGSRLVAPWLFGAFLFPVAAVALAAWIRFVDRSGPAGGAAVAGRSGPADGSGSADRAVGAPWPRSATAGILSIGAYVLILLAYSVAPLSVVAPLRESAVVLASGWGSLRMREAEGGRDAARRIGAAILVLLGAVLIALER